VDISRAGEVKAEMKVMRTFTCRFDAFTFTSERAWSAVCVRVVQTFVVNVPAGLIWPSAEYETYHSRKIKRSKVGVKDRGTEVLTLAYGRL